MSMSLNVYQAPFSIFLSSYSLPVSLSLFPPPSCARARSFPLFFPFTLSRSRILTTGRLWLLGSNKLQFSFAKEPYKSDNTLQKRPIILSILLTVATPYPCLPPSRPLSSFNSYDYDINWGLYVYSY